MRCCCEASCYKPVGVPFGSLKEDVLFADELEALILCDAKGLCQEDAAKKMGVSQPTLNRMLSSGRKKVANAIFCGNAIKLEKTRLEQSL